MIIRFALASSLLLAGPAFAQQSPPPAPPPMAADTQLNLDLSTGGRVVVQLRPDVAPGHVARVRELAGRGFYDGLAFHRVIEGFMAQTGDPKGDGTGGSELPDLAAEFSGLPHARGAVAMARASDPNSANSQFYIMLMPRLSLDGKYTVIGRVVAGMEYVDRLNRGEPPPEPSRLVRASIGAAPAPEPPKVAGPDDGNVPAVASQPAPGAALPPLRGLGPTG